MHQGKLSFRFKKEDYSQQMQSPFLSTRMWLGTGTSVSDEVTLSESRQPALLATVASLGKERHGAVITSKPCSCRRPTVHYPVTSTAA